MVQSVLFVCMGNICRSPAAEGVFRHLMTEAGREAEFEIDSAGTIGYHAGAPADSRMQAAARMRGFSLDSVSRRIQTEDFNRFDWIVVMDEDNYREVGAMDNGGGAQVVRMCAYCTQHDDDEVPDPYYGGTEGFEYVLDMLEDACTELLRRV